MRILVIEDERQLAGHVTRALTRNGHCLTAVHDGLEGFPAAWLEAPAAKGAQLRIRDGFLQIRTPNAMRGYVTETSQPLLDDGWLSTADRCEIRSDRVLIRHIRYIGHRLSYRICMRLIHPRHLRLPAFPL